ncbi:cellular tumor antigen p53 [Epargyreus clarus]|uniref:cellular tumor antigen p53 n=1 Tax=Epargyreus clarus TaxID=520877 RepID=UPI003C2FC53A
MYKSEQDETDDALFLNMTRMSPDDVYVTLEHLDNINWNVVENYTLQQNQDDTMDAATKFSPMPQEFIPYCPTGPPDSTCFPGSLKFEVEICGADTHKSKFLYSHRLNRIYVDMGYSFSVQFRWDAAEQPAPAMYVRATTVFQDQAQAQKRVTRCTQHYHETPKNGVELSEAMRSGVLVSSRGAGAQDVYYCGAAPDSWHSVLVRLAAPTTHAYQFACKNSCSSGINRRTIAVLFTLEDHTGKVWGRQTVGARVCSCPKREIKREEGEAPPGKRRAPPPPAAAPAPAPGKRIRLEVVDEVIQLPPINVVGRRVYTAGLGVMLSMMEEKRAMAARSHLPTEELDASIAQIKAHLEKPSDSQK